MNAGQSPGASKPPASLARKIWRVIYWGSLLAGAWGIIQMLRVAPAPQITVSPGAERSAEQKLAALAVPLPPSSAAPQPPRVALTQDEFDSYLDTHLALGPGAGGAGSPSGQPNTSVRDLRVTFEGDRASIYVLFHLAVKDVSFQLAGRLHVVDGYLRFEITDGSLGYLSLPGWALNQGLSPLITNLQVRSGLRLPPGIRDIRVENGELVFERQ